MNAPPVLGITKKTTGKWAFGKFVPVPKTKPNLVVIIVRIHAMEIDLNLDSI